MENKVQKGFTLIELLIVIVIIGILAAVVTSNFLGVRQRARDVQRKTDLAQLQTALQFIFADKGYYPRNHELGTCGSPYSYSGVTYMQKFPCDPKSKTGAEVKYYYFAGPANCDNGSNGPCTTYTLTACLENTSDADSNQKKGYTLPSNVTITCQATTPYTVTNPL